MVIWHLGNTTPDPGDRRTHRSLRLIAVAFLVLSAYLVVASIRSLVLAERPTSSPLGIAFMTLTVCVMFALATWKRRLAGMLGSEPLDREAEVTYVDAALSASIVVALVVNPLFGWWWADAAAAFGIGMYAVYAGVAVGAQGAPHESA